MAGRLLLSASLLLAGAWSGMGQATSVTEVGSSVAEDNGTRHPALYSQEFNDCLDGRSLINLTEFDVAYYPDESTVTLRLGGMTDIQRDDTMRTLPKTLCRSIYLIDTDIAPSQPDDRRLWKNLFECLPRSLRGRNERPLPCASWSTD